METFDLSRLTDFDFEAVCKDIFEEELGVPLELFSAGADAGVDLRRFQMGRGSLIVQCKHWHRSGRAKLIEHIENTEAPKVAKLQPSRYILATSVPLTKSAKDRLFEALKPYVQTPGDIYGKDEIDALLRKHDHLVRRHLRLWLTSASVLSSLLAKSVVTRSQELAREFDATLRTYAENPSYARALSILEAGHVCVIAGLPGIGKTTLCHVLCAHYMSAGYELVEISEDVEEANQLWDDEVSQVFYYDDFLGQTTLDEKLGKNEDSRLLALMKRVASSPNKRFVLTTREYILAQARQRYERLDRHSFDIQTCVIDLTDYTVQARASILYNHVYDAPLPREVKAIFANPDVYRPIIDHPNFNPRIIAATLASGQPELIANEIVSNLDDPHRVWDHIVKNQLSETDVKLLKVLLSFMSDVHLEALQRLWLEYGESLRDLRKALGVLDGTMLRSSELRGRIYVGFHNPSVRDYLVNYVQKDISEVLSMISLVRKFEQLEALWLVFPASGGGPMSFIYRECIKELEGAAVAAFDAEPMRLWGSITRNAVRRAWLFLEMGLDLQSDTLRRMALESAGDEDTVPNAEDSGDVIALLQVLKRDESEEAQTVFTVCVSWAVEWALGDLSDWNLIQSAEEVLRELAEVAPGLETEQALNRLEDERDSYAEDAFEDWASDYRDPVTPASEMKDIVEHYRDRDDSPYFDGRDATVERLDEYDAAHQGPSLYSRGSQNGWSRKSYNEVQEMMQTLRAQAD
ncbi:nSTAND3 domain-containing NTPase [Streptomyces sp. NPDC001492]